MINTIIFDIGRVLVGYDWDGYFMEVFEGDRPLVNRIEDAFFGHGMWDELDRGVMSGEEILQAFISADPELEEEITMVYGKMGEVIYQYKFTKPWLRELKSRGYKLLYLSNWSYQLLEQSPDVMDFTKLMDGGIYSCHVKIIKPDEGIYKALADKYDLTPSECVFLDDRIDNIKAAKEFGYEGIVVKNHEQAVEELEEILK